jgi:hypothetical protein
MAVWATMETGSTTACGKDEICIAVDQSRGSWRLCGRR